MSIGSVVVDIKIGISKETAETALKLVDLYLNENEGATIVESVDDDGRVRHEFDTRCT